MDKHEFVEKMSAVSPNIEVLGDFSRLSDNIKVKCRKCGYEWERRANILLGGTGCPVCAGKVIICGVNDLYSLRPSLMDEWDWDRNSLDPRTVAPGSGKKAWWKCSKCGNRWETIIDNRSNKNSGCPECKKKVIGRKNQLRNVVVGKTDFLSEYPDLEKEWAFDKNENINPRDFSSGSSHVVWWRCSVCGHEWRTSIGKRCSGGSACSECIKKRIGVILHKKAIKDPANSLAMKRPDLLNEWDYEKNTDITPQELTPGSDYPVWWKCSKCGYNWPAKVSYKTYGGKCPCCTGRRVWKGHNDLETLFPDICKEWDFNRNSTKPDEYTVGSEKKVWWKCSVCGHEYLARIYNKTKRHTGCPVCTNQIVVQGINDLETKAPELMIEWDYEKNTEKPSSLSTGNTRRFNWICSVCGHKWKASIDNRYRGKGCPKCRNMRAAEALGKYHLQNGNNSLSTRYPDIAKDWDYERNKGKTPNDITPGSTLDYWWICQLCGNHYQESAYLKVKRLIGCPKCTKRMGSSVPEQIIYYYLKQVYPDAINSYKPEWLEGGEIDVYIPKLKVGIEYDGMNWHRNVKQDYSKDKLISEKGISLIRIREEGCPSYNSNSLKIETGKVDQQYIYMNAVVVNIIKTLNGISTVRKKVNVNIENDIFDIIALFKEKQKEKTLAYLYPELANEWNYEKNRKLLPEYVTAHSGRKVWWRCSVCGYEWNAVISSRTNGFGCPHCNNQAPMSGKDDLKTLYPEIAKEWDYERNTSLLPEEVLSKSGKPVWWKCSICGHNWKEIIGLRTTWGAGCPHCGKGRKKSNKGRKVINLDTGKIYNSLTEASIDVGIGHGSISACCLGKQNTAAGYHWRYYDSTGDNEKNFLGKI